VEKSSQAQSRYGSGAGGSIGSELCSQIARWQPSPPVLMGHGVNSIFETYLELMQPIYRLFRLCGVCRYPRPGAYVSGTAQFKPNVIPFTQQRIKHVPLMVHTLRLAFSTMFWHAKRD
jgi:FlaA1/EpsC-like NDP-sugar epimerase